MKVVVQRCDNGSVSVNGKIINKINKGFVLLVGFHISDTEKDIDYIVKKIINLRIFDDDNGIMNKNILDAKGEILSISQFTLQAVTRDGNRPSYHEAMKGEDAIKLYNQFNQKLNNYVNTYPGVFGAEMKVSLINDGPITIIIDSKAK